MAAHFFDIDGTLVRYHTNEWLSGAKEYLINLHKGGHQIYFITRRGSQGDGKEWSISRTYDTILKDLREVGVNFQILFNVKTARYLHDDSECFAMNRKQNEAWD